MTQLHFLQLYQKIYFPGHSNNNWKRRHEEMYKEEDEVKSRMRKQHLSAHLLLPAAISEPLLQKAFLKLPAKHHEISFELNGILNAARSQVGVYIFFFHLPNSHLSQQSPCLPQLIGPIFLIHFVKSEISKLLLFQTMFIVLVEYQVQYLFSGALTVHKDAPQTVSEYRSRCAAVRGRREAKKVTQSGIEVLLVVVVWAGFDLSLSFPFLLPVASIIPSILPSVALLSLWLAQFSRFRLCLQLQAAKLVGIFNEYSIFRVNWQELRVL